MFKILTDSHKLIAREIHKNIVENYDVDLDIDKLQWGSIAPDVLPYYKFKRHYKDESLEFISKEIVHLIFLGRYSNLKNKNSFFIRQLSKKVGIISHYLCDFTCYPHAYRVTFMDDMKSHLKYESDLNEYAINIHKFNDVNLSTEDLNIYGDDSKKLADIVGEYIDSVVEEYMEDEKSFSNDLDYALKLSSNVALFIIEMILNYSEEMEYQFN
ncbi:Zinc dependent phospholipase C [Anaerosphaera aminiphila DSM 21120]|uniref:Zinc dependent phospholipase C n=1 Tax=Anaerosphaera aminiphila DSM 21120 TaxID=1120995 RepID=A0A1M5RFT2_9FIRM|nr:zinc dependent phospholipase C family protein [Anaerosphaera aminiphila]SHH25134.1 Zinc dependent phospholipase C [Anaerosphaera aminiphila DSM 21120]